MPAPSARAAPAHWDETLERKGPVVSYILGHDPATLREVVDTTACAARLEELGDQRSLPSLLEKVWLLKVLGRLEDALVVSEESVRVARMAGTRRDLLRARILHATVMQQRGAYAAADHELTTCIDEAEGQRLLQIAAFAAQHRGRVRFDAGDLDDARKDFKRSLFLRREAGASEEELGSALLAIEAVDRRRSGASLAS